MHDAVLENIAQFIQERSGLYFSSKRPVLKKRLEERMENLNVPDLACYWRYLRNTAQEESVLLELLTINETSYFRNPGQFAYLKERIIPEFERERGNDVIRSWGRSDPLPHRKIMKLRVLCAGCSTGEEPYSIGMTLFDTLKYPGAWDIEILAGDLNESCIRAAAAGCYETDRLRGLPLGYAEKYMERGDKGAAVKEEIKKLIRFCHLNLNDILKGEPLPVAESDTGLFDIIFCRNVMIYFSPETQQQLVDALYRLLAAGGYLFTGDAEPLHMYDHDFEAVREAGSLIYRKMETSNNAEAV